MPSEAQIREEIGPAVRTLQIIVVAIAFGLLTFLGVAVYMSATGQFRPRIR